MVYLLTFDHPAQLAGFLLRNCLLRVFLLMECWKSLYPLLNVWFCKQEHPAPSAAIPDRALIFYDPFTPGAFLDPGQFGQCFYSNKFLHQLAPYLKMRLYVVGKKNYPFSEIRD